MAKLLYVIILASLGVWLHQKHGALIVWYWRFFRTNLIATWFYTTYDHCFRDIRFHPELQPCLDVYAPAQGANYPVLIFIHGGGWHKYNKRFFATVALKFLPKDLVVVVPDYTLYPQATYQQMVQEVAAASAWTLDNIEQYGGDPDRVVIAGHSAGAHLMMLAMADPQCLSQFGHHSSDLRGIIGLSGVYDIVAQDRYGIEIGASREVMRGVVGGPTNFVQTSPIHHVHAQLPPILLIHGAQDTVVPVRSSEDFGLAVKQAGGECTLKCYETAGHADFLFKAVVERQAQVVADMADFTYLVTRNKETV